MPCSCNSSPAGSVFRCPEDGHRLHIANCASRSAPSPRRSLGAGAEAADPGQGRALGGAKVGRGITEAIVSRRWFGARLKRAILSCSFLSLTEAQTPEGRVP
ncbi:MAG: hypothetical protein ACP5PV_05025 [Methanothrix sp.]